MKPFFLLFLLCFSTLLAQATNYYVSTSGGNNANPGTSPTQAFKTIQKALNTVSAGDNIYVVAGTYFERLVWMTSGSANAFITLTNYNGGTVSIDGSSSGGNTLLLIDSKSYVKVQNLTFRKNFRDYAEGLHILGAGRDIQVTNCIFKDIGWTSNANAMPNEDEHNANPLLVEGTETDSLYNITISSNQIYDCITGFSEGLTINGNVSNFTIANNIVHDITNIGIDCAGHYDKGAPAALDQARNGVVKQNRVYKCVSPVADFAGYLCGWGQKHCGGAQYMLPKWGRHFGWLRNRWLYGF